MSAELASAIPEEGGYYIWVRRALGPFCAYLCGWWTWLYAWVDVAIYPGLFAVNCANLLRTLGVSTHFDESPFLKWSVGLIIIIPLTWLNIRGTKKVGDVSLGFMAVLLLPFVAMVALGLPRVFADVRTPFLPLVADGESLRSALNVGLFSVMWNYLGWDSITTVSAEIEQPERTLPRALIVGVLIVIASYFLPALVGLAYQPDPSLWKEGSWTTVAKFVGGRWLAVAVAFTGMLSSAGLFSATLLASSRIPFVLAQDGFLPRGVTKLSQRYGTPTVAILISAFFYTIFSYSSLANLKVVDVILYSFALSFEFVALVVLRIREPNLPRPYRIRGGLTGVILLSIAPMALVVFAIINQISETKGEAMKLTAICLALVAVAYPILRRRNKVGASLN